MNRTTQILAVFACSMLLLNASCKKSAKTTSSCTSSLHAYTAPDSVTFGLHGSVFTCTHGIINTSTAAITSSGSFSDGLIFTSQATFNNSDNCYYLFGANTVIVGYISAGSYPLYKVDASGSLTTLAAPDTFKYSSVAYNAYTNKLYCQKNGSLAQLSTTSSSYSAIIVAAPVHPFASEPFSPGNITVDNATGNMYFVTGSSPNYYIEKYLPGSTGTTVVATASASMAPIELRFNKNDNMLYAMEGTGAGVSEFVKIDPTTGTITSLTSLGTLVDVDMYSATLDPCSNRYIISSARNGSIGTSAYPFGLYQLSMTGAILQSDSTATFYQGLDVAY